MCPKFFNRDRRFPSVPGTLSQHRVGLNLKLWKMKGEYLYQGCHSSHHTGSISLSTAVAQKKWEGPSQRWLGSANRGRVSGRSLAGETGRPMELLAVPATRPPFSECVLHISILPFHVAGGSFWKFCFKIQAICCSDSRERINFKFK